ncbi:MAG: 1-(5-phosphoribosyl)-5-[(5-phosphoribosylamino)methylideneamino]imidazole-4-carboxamide isomerase [Armatimonadetes bacterium]|nr:1-(5-phosphoribosyl)-5-[(5-phosphoribosylamino)methylideneamino]imidazole-4-carboxamide isomerase [Armatimonadota bacterium]
MVIYPAIDLSEGQCVRLSRGEMDRKTVYSDDPGGMAQQWIAAGGRFLHVVDLDGSFEGRPRNLEAVRAICDQGVPVQVGGGIRTIETIDLYFSVGVTRVIIGTAAVRDPQLLSDALRSYGDRIVVDIGARDGKVAVRGWADRTELDAVEFARSVEQAGARRVVFTDVHSDGALEGPNVAAQARLAEALRIPVIASGGITTLADVQSIAALAPLGVEGLIIGRALYERTVDLAAAIAAADSA